MLQQHQRWNWVLTLVSCVLILVFACMYERENEKGVPDAQTFSVHICSQPEYVSVHMTLYLRAITFDAFTTSFSARIA